MGLVLKNIHGKIFAKVLTFRKKVVSLYQQNERDMLRYECMKHNCPYLVKKQVWFPVYEVIYKCRLHGWVDIKKVQKCERCCGNGTKR